jgi:hypothetical protein
MAIKRKTFQPLLQLLVIRQKPGGLTQHDLMAGFDINPSFETQVENGMAGCVHQIIPSAYLFELTWLVWNAEDKDTQPIS